MAIQFFNPPVPPSEGTSATQKVNLLKAEFGDGYIQTTRKGIKHIRKSLSVRWDLLTPTDAESILHFFNDHGGYISFYYTPSDETVPIKWICTDWSDTRGQGGFRSIQASFEEAFDDRGVIEYRSGIGMAINGRGYARGISEPDFSAVFEAVGSGNAWAVATILEDQVGAAAGVGSALGQGSKLMRSPGAAAGVGAAIATGTGIRLAQGFSFTLGSAYGVGTTV